MATIIHAEKLLAQSHMLAFGKNLTDDTMVTMYIEQTGFAEAKPFNQMRDFFTTDEYAQYVTDDNCVIQFVPDIDSDILQIVGYDWFWWRKPFRKKEFGRIEQYHLFDKELPAKKEKKAAEPAEMHTIYIACKLPDGSIEPYDNLTGTHKQLVAFVNTKFAEIQLKTQFEATPVFAIDPKDDSFDAITYCEFDELVEKGVFAL